MPEHARIVVSGYYGMDNAGDELILATVIKDIKKYFPLSFITVLSGNPRQTAALYSVNAVQRKSIFSIIHAILKSDLVITGGGGIFQDKTSSASFYYYAAIVCCARLFGKKNFIYAVEISRLKNRLHYMILKYVFSSAHYTSVRNRESIRVLEVAGYYDRRITLVPDPVYEAPFLRGSVTRNTFASSPRAIGIVLRTVHNKSEQYNRSYLHEMKRLIEQCVQSHLQPVLIVFDKKHDLAINKKLHKSLSSPVLFIEWQSIDEVLDIFKTLSVVISSRLHGLILAQAFNIPAIGIMPDNDNDGGKVRSYLEWTLGRYSYFEKNINADNIMQCINSIFENNGQAYPPEIRSMFDTLQKNKDLLWKSIAQKRNRGQLSF